MSTETDQPEQLYCETCKTLVDHGRINPACMPTDEGESWGGDTPLIESDGTCSNFWSDGTKGVQKEMREYLDDEGCFPHCQKCFEELTFVSRVK